ncbi:PPE family protein [Mycobacterium botniense]|uniref:PPE family protein PPE43 n=1 Tax=Mycobacterium botniense TaxID=84962 RepID=A0A7I9Y0F7_9MYCO|nr:PPE family protein [Mycobacterium botniense]GFG75548.1 PPE family protein PPE43 [Mycobacterium botniense]
MVVDFGALPPEVNSALMYTGAGAGPMMAAARTWNSLAAELSSATLSYHSVIATLAGDEWRGPASQAMAAAVTPYLRWMDTTAAAAEHAANQALASAAAYEAAFAMTVPPEVVAANRAQLAVLVATNLLGHNTPAIMATEAHYTEMWARDAAAMYGYAASAQLAGKLQPLTAPAQTVNPCGIAAQAAAVGAAGTSGAQTELSQLISGLRTAVASLASPLSSAGKAAGLAESLQSVNSFLGIPFVSDTVNGSVNTAAWFVANTIPTAVALGHTVGDMTPAAAVADVTAPAGLAADPGPVLAGSVASAGAAGVAGPGGIPVLAGLGSASSVGGLSVPAGWSAATPAGTGAATLGGSGWTASADQATSCAAVPAGMPAAAAGGRGGFGFGAPRYGFKPTVMPKQVLV